MCAGKIMSIGRSFPRTRPKLLKWFRYATSVLLDRPCPALYSRNRRTSAEYESVSSMSKDANRSQPFLNLRLDVARFSERGYVEAFIEWLAVLRVSRVPILPALEEIDPGAFRDEVHGVLSQVMSANIRYPSPACQQESFSGKRIGTKSGSVFRFLSDALGRYSYRWRKCSTSWRVHLHPSRLLASVPCTDGSLCDGISSPRW